MGLSKKLGLPNFHGYACLRIELEVAKNSRKTPNRTAAQQTKEERIRGNQKGQIRGGGEGRTKPGSKECGQMVDFVGVKDSRKRPKGYQSQQIPVKEQGEHQQGQKEQLQ